MESEMIDEIMRKLDGLAPLAKAMNDESDEVSNFIQRIEARLKELSIGLEVSVPLPSGGSLRYGREGRWALYRDVPGHPPLALRDCRRTVRVEAIEVLPALIDALGVATREARIRIREAKEAAGISS